MADAWPATLPDYFLTDDFTWFEPDNTVRTQSISGRLKTRRHSTQTQRHVQGSMAMTAAQRTTFDTFFVTTLKSGSLPFQGLNNPITGADTVWMFADDPVTRPFSAESGNYFRIILHLRALPDAPA